jgi:hypothetical protein
MKTIKVILSLFMTIAFVASASAQLKADRTFDSDLSSLSIEYKGFNPSFQDRMTDAPDQTGFHIGARYQPVFGNINVNTHGGNTVTASMQASHGFAVSLNYYFSNYFGTHLEAMWSRQDYGFDEGTLSLTYLTFPLLASLNTNYGRRVNFNIAAGPYFGMNVGADASFNQTGDQATATAAADVNAVDLGVAYGGGVDFGFGPNNGVHLRLGYRGTSGLLDIAASGVQTDENTVSVVARDSRMQTHGFYVGVMFKL